DQAVGLGLDAPAPLEHVPELVEVELGLLGVDHERTAPLALRLERRSDLASRSERSAPGLGRGLAAVEYAVHPVVVEAHVRADERAVEARAGDDRLTQLELDGHRRAVGLRAQRA